MTVPPSRRLLEELFLLALIFITVSSSGSWFGLGCAFVANSPSTFENKNADTSVRHRGRVAYDGTGFAGFQFQSTGKRTVQGHLEEVLSRRFNRSVRVLGAGRTDAGVHARGQAFQFDLLKCEVDALNGTFNQLQSCLNSMLTQDVRVWNISQAPLPVVKQAPNGNGLVTNKWNVMYDAKQKLYSYRISTGCVYNPLTRHSRWHVDWSVDTNMLARVLRYFEGTHNFRAFAGAVEQNEKKKGKAVSTIRTIHKAVLEDEGNGNYRIDILLRGALYKMVRNMVGTAVDVCSERGRIGEEEFLRFLHQKGKDDHDLEETSQQFTRVNNPCKPAPAHGLTLERVYYDDDF